MELFNVILTIVSISSVTAWMGYEFAKLQAFNKQKKEEIDIEAKIEAREERKLGDIIMEDILLNPKLLYLQDKIEENKAAAEKELLNKLNSPYMGYFENKDCLAKQCNELVKSSYDFGEKSEVLKNLEHLQENEPPVMQKDAAVNSRNTCFTDTFKPQNCASNIVGKHKPKLNGGW